MTAGSTSDTIVALSSGAGRAGVAVLRLSGPEARFAAEMISGPAPAPRRAGLRRLTHPLDGGQLDEAIVLFFPGPASFTGEDIVEFHVHGSQAVVRAVLRALQATGTAVRMAEPGEFARRAFVNGKMDLAAIEGLASLIDSETEWQRRQALRQMEGALGERVQAWRRSLITAMAMVEAEIDFSDETDVPSDISALASHHVTTVAQQIKDVLSHADLGERIRDGYRVVIAGAPNVGKSSLLNALARREAALVSPIAGTTRDVVEVRCDIRGYPVLLHDTAGLRESDDPVEQMGVARARQRIAEADLVLQLGEHPDADRTGTAGVTLRIATKSDLGAATYPHDIAISAQTGEGLDGLLARIGDILETQSGGETALVSNERQRLALAGAGAALERILANTELPAELIAEEVRHAVHKLDHLIGRVDHEHVLDEIFARFCIGK